MRMIQQDQKEENLKANKASVAKKRLICPRMLMIVKNIPAPGTAAQINYTASPFRKKRKEALNG
ncbi:hypothetical protein [Kosakonia sp.]|uniref:hypothetical protein n=1 Tax=Kosakonia sp. TaxID=1916651 RepID=UPI0028A84C4F|nr:hypothetical protein [Kosakonia sp.]